jgi:hypothetical protein
MKYFVSAIILLQLAMLVRMGFKNGIRTGLALVWLLVYLFGMFLSAKYLPWNKYLFTASMLGMIFFALFAVYIWVKDGKRSDA